MTVAIADRADITLEAFLRVAWGREPVELAPVAVARIDAAHRAFLVLVESLQRKNPQALIYGVTTAPGDGATTVLSADEQRRRPTRLWTAASFGDPLPERVARGIILARLTTLVAGNAAVRSEVACEVAAMLDGRSLPPVPAEANGGAGEILALGQLFYDLSERLQLEPKERMALINGSPCAAALVADAALSGRRRLDLAERVFVLAAEAIRAPFEAYAEDLEPLWADEHETAALRRIRSLLDPAGAERLPSQAPVSFRILPRMLGQARRAQAEGEAAARTALAAVTDNPVFIPPGERHREGAIESNGSFHNARATAALDGLAFSWADLCQLAQRQCDKVFVHPVTADVLSDEWGLKPVHMVQAGWAEEARALAQPSLLSGATFGQNDVASMSFFAWRKAVRIGRCLDASLAVLAGVATHALQGTRRSIPPALIPLVDEVNRVFPPVEGVRRLGPDFGALADRFTELVFEVD